MESPSEPRVDGRRARRERGRQAALDAMVDLVMAGHMPPTPEQVSERAGVSVATLFRYFENLGEMYLAAGLRYVERFEHLSVIDDIGEGDLDHRIATFVASRIRLFEATAPMQLFARKQMHRVDGIGDFFSQETDVYRAQLARQFETELKQLSPARRSDRMAVLLALFSFQSWDALGRSGLKPKQLKRAWLSALTDLLALP